MKNKKFLIILIIFNVEKIGNVANFGWQTFFAGSNSTFFKCLKILSGIVHMH